MNPQDHSESGRQSQSGSDAGPFNKGRGVATSLSKVFPAGAPNAGGQTCNTTGLIGDSAWVRDLVTEGVEPNPGPFKQYKTDPTAPYLYADPPQSSPERASFMIEQPPTSPSSDRVTDCLSLKRHLTLSNALFAGKVIVIGGVSFVCYKICAGIYGWYQAISSPISALETAATTEYHTLQTKYDYRWYDYFCPMCLLSKYIANSNNNSSNADHHNHVMHALNGNIDFPARITSQGFSCSTHGIWSPVSWTASSLFAGPQAIKVTVRSFANAGNTASRIDVEGQLRGVLDFGLEPESWIIYYNGNEAPKITFTPAASYAAVGDDKGVSVVFTPFPYVQGKVAVGNQPVWTTPYGPAQAGHWTPHGTWETPRGEFSCPEEADGDVFVNGKWWSTGDAPPIRNCSQPKPKAKTPSRKPKPQCSNSVFILNQLASQDTDDRRLPAYSAYIKHGPDHDPRFDVSITYRGSIYHGLGGKDKRQAASFAADKVLEKIDQTKLNSVQRTTISGWTRDLTAEGVEPNPGPPVIYAGNEELTAEDLAYRETILKRNAQLQQAARPAMTTEAIEAEARENARAKLSEQSALMLRDHIAHMATFTNHTGDFYMHAAIVCSIPTTTNRYAALADCADLEEPSDTTECAQPEPRRAPRPSTYTTDQRAPRTKPPPKAEQPKKPEVKAFDRAASLRRIAEKLQAEPLRIRIWLYKPGSTAFKRTVCDLVFGGDWENKPTMTEYEWSAYCYFNNIDLATEVDVLLRDDTKYMKTSEASKELFMRGIGADYANVKAQTHNKVMHALNGNILTPTWQKVLEADSSAELIKHNEAPKRLQRGIELQVMISTVQGASNPNYTNAHDMDRLRADVQQDTVTRVPNCIMPIPSTSLIPRHYRTGGVLGDSTERLRVTVVTLADYYAEPLVPTELSKQISDQVANNKSSNWRQDNMLLNGIRNFDVANINVAMANTSLSLERPALILELLHSLFAMDQQLPALNKSQFQLIDQNTIPTGRPVMGANNSTVFGESCGGLTPVYPFGGGTGSVAFHVSYQSIPAEERDTAIILPSSVLQAADTASAAVALFCMMMSKYPFCLPTLTVPTTDGAGNNPGNQRFVPNEALVDIPGPTVLNIVVPARGPERNPTTQVEANNNAFVRPQTGSTGTTTYPPSTVFNISYIGAGGYQAYKLTDFLFSWILDLDITTIKTFVGRLNTVMNFNTAMEVARDAVVDLCQHFPRLIVSSAAPSSAPTQALAYKTSYVSCLNPTPTTADWPLLNNIQPDYRCFQMNCLLWNKVALGLATSDALRPELMTNFPVHLGSPSSNYWSRLEAWATASNWNSFFAQTGLTTKSWNEAYTDTGSQWTQDLAINLYATDHALGTLIPSRYGRIVRNLCENRFGTSPALATSSVGTKRIQISRYERWLPGSTYASCFNVDGTEVLGLPPLNLTDHGIQYLTTRLGRYEASYPRPNDSCYAFGPEDGDLLTPFVAADGSVANPLKDNILYWPLDDGPELADNEIFTRRIWYTTVGRSISNWQMNALPESFPADGAFPKQRAIPLNPGENLPPQIACANTLSVPRMSANQQQIMFWLPTVNADIPVKAMSKRALLTRSAWLVDGTPFAPMLQITGKKKRHAYDIASEPTAFLESHVETATMETPVTTAAVREQAVSPEQLPTSNAVSRPTEQPTSQQPLLE